MRAVYSLHVALRNVQPLLIRWLERTEAVINISLLNRVRYLLHRVHLGHVLFKPVDKGRGLVLTVEGGDELFGFDCSRCLVNDMIDSLLTRIIFKQLSDRLLSLRVTGRWRS